MARIGMGSSCRPSHMTSTPYSPSRPMTASQNRPCVSLTRAAYASRRSATRRLCVTRPCASLTRASIMRSAVSDSTLSVAQHAAYASRYVPPDSSGPRTRKRLGPGYMYCTMPADQRAPQPVLSMPRTRTCMIALRDCMLTCQRITGQDHWKRREVSIAASTTA